MNIWKTEPAVLIGTIAAILVLVAQQLLSSGIVSSEGAVNWANFVISATPLLAAVLIRGKVSPAT